MLFPARNVRLILPAALWLLLVGAGFAQLMRYDLTPGPLAASPSDWPADSQISRQPEAFNVVMAVHPRCPCSRASLEELSQLLAQCSQPVSVHLLVFKPSNASANWERQGLWEAAEQLQGVSLDVDLDGAGAERFGAKTSGQTLLYGKDGHLLFSGGITASRGAVGSNPGLEALKARIDGETEDFASTPVFGCSLRDLSSRNITNGKP